MPYRCVLGCEPVPGTALHVFPNPKKFPDRFKIWVNSVNGRLDTPAHVEYFKIKRICDIHFSDRHRNRFNRLSEIAIPTLHLPRLSTKVLQDSLVQTSTSNNSSNVEAPDAKVSNETYVEDGSVQQIVPEDGSDTDTLDGQEDTNQSESCLEIWNYFEPSSLSPHLVKCTVCEESIGSKLPVMIKHFQKKHPNVIKDLPQDSHNEPNNLIDDNEIIYSEIVYLDDSFHENVKDSITPEKPDDVNQDSVKLKCLETSKKKCDPENTSKNDDQMLRTNEELKTNEGENEIDKFGLYIVRMLKKMPNNENIKLQAEIVKLIKSSQPKEKINSINNTVLNDVTNDVTQSEHNTTIEDTNTGHLGRGDYHPGHSNQEATKLLSTIWTYFDRESPLRVKCAVCKESVTSKLRVMENHMRRKHANFAIEIDQNFDDHLSDEIEHKCTEQNIDEPGRIIKTKELKVNSESYIKRIPFIKKCRRDSYENHIPSKKRKVDDDSDEIDQFGTYIACLLKKMTIKESRQLQLQIVSLLMSRKIKDNEELEEKNRTNSNIHGGYRIHIKDVHTKTKDVTGMEAAVSNLLENYSIPIAQNLHVIEDVPIRIVNN